jgi:hypothetical protein
MNQHKNWIVRVIYKNHSYYLRVEDYAGEVLAEGDTCDSSVLKLLKQTNVGAEWFVNKANETYVWNINNGELKVGNWGWSCIVEGGAIEDWGDCSNLEG